MLPMTQNTKPPVTSISEAHPMFNLIESSDDALAQRKAQKTLAKQFMEKGNKRVHTL